MKNKKTIQKFGKHYYLGLGKDGKNYWLEAESWDCDWYWGCGYVHTFTNNLNPEKSRDIGGHQHFDSLFFNRVNNAHNAWYNFFATTPYTDKEVWEILELMKTIYTLKEVAEVFYRGGSHFTTNPASDKLKDLTIYDKINKEILPECFSALAKIMTES